MKHSVLALMLALLITASTLYVDDDVSYYIDWTDSDWAYLQPSVEWRLADGLDWDTTGAGEYRNYGSLDLATELTDVNQPGLTEGILSKDQSALELDGLNDNLYVNDNGVLDITTESLTVLVVFRGSNTAESQLTLIGKYDINALRSWVIDVGDGIGDDGLMAVLCGDGATTIKWYGTTADVLDGSWKMGGFVWDSTADTLSLILNGTQPTTTKQTNNVFTALYSTTAKVTVGASYSAGTAQRFFPGDIAWVGVWVGTALNLAQTDSLYDAMSPDGTTSLPYPSLQSAVYQATASDVIDIYPGRYQETVEIGKVLTITAQNVSDRPEFYGTDLLASSGTNGIKISAAVDLSYLTIRGYSNLVGMGLKLDASSDNSDLSYITLDSCRTGIYIDDADDDSISYITVDGAGLGGGWGIQTNDGASAVSLAMTNSILVNNVLAIAVTDSFTVTLSDNNYWNNTSNFNGISSGISVYYLNPIFVRGYYPKRGQMRDRGAWGVLNMNYWLHEHWGQLSWSRGAYGR